MNVNNFPPYWYAYDVQTSVTPASEDTHKSLHQSADEIDMNSFLDAEFSQEYPILAVNSELNSANPSPEEDKKQVQKETGLYPFLKIENPMLLVPTFVAPLDLTFSTSSSITAHSKDVVDSNPTSDTPTRKRKRETSRKGRNRVTSTTEMAADTIEAKIELRKLKNRISAQNSRNRKQLAFAALKQEQTENRLELEKLKNERAEFFRSGERVESYVDQYCISYPRSRLKSLEEYILENEMLKIQSSGDMKTQLFQKRIPEVVQTIVTESIDNRKQSEAQIELLNERIKLLEQQNQQLQTQNNNLNKLDSKIFQNKQIGI
jgi:hypothetical protein